METSQAAIARSQYGLKAFVHRELVLRLLVGCVGIAALFSAGAYLTRYDIIGQDAVTHAVNGVERLEARVQAIAQETGITPAAAIQRALDEEPDHRVISRHGQFALVRFYKADGSILAQRALAGPPQSAQLEAWLKQLVASLSGPDEPRSAKVEIGGRPHIRVAFGHP